MAPFFCAQKNNDREARRSRGSRSREAWNQADLEFFCVCVVCVVSVGGVRPFTIRVRDCLGVEGREGEVGIRD